jgi:hypothetical protein
METEHSNDRIATSQQQPKPREILGWLVEQVTILAEAMGEAMTPVRLKIYAVDLADLDRSQLQTAFARARRECRFFPKIAELRELAGIGAKDARDVEAEAAWKFVNDYLRKWGVDLMPLYSHSGGVRKQIDPPALPERIDYALRRIGGLSGLNQITKDSRPFMFRDFCEAYNLVPTATLLAPQLGEKFRMIEGQVSVKQLTDGTQTEQTREPAEAQKFKPKPFPNQHPLTNAQRADRHEMLRQQTETLLRQRAQRAATATTAPASQLEIDSDHVKHRDGSEAKALDIILSENPNWTQEQRSAATQ